MLRNIGGNQSHSFDALIYLEWLKNMAFYNCSDWRIIFTWDLPNFKHHILTLIQLMMKMNLLCLSKPKVCSAHQSPCLKWVLSPFPLCHLDLPILLIPTSNSVLPKSFFWMLQQKQSHLLLNTCLSLPPGLEHTYCLYEVNFELQLYFGLEVYLGVASGAEGALISDFVAAE